MQQPKYQDSNVISKEIREKTKFRNIMAGVGVVNYLTAALLAVAGQVSAASSMVLGGMYSSYNAINSHFEAKDLKKLLKLIDQTPLTEF